MSTLKWSVLRAKIIYFLPICPLCNLGGGPIDYRHYLAGAIEPMWCVAMGAIIKWQSFKDICCQSLYGAYIPLLNTSIWRHIATSYRLEDIGNIGNTEEFSRKFFRRNPWNHVIWAYFGQQKISQTKSVEQRDWSKVSPREETWLAYFGLTFAELGEHSKRKREVAGSMPASSNDFFFVGNVLTHYPRA